MSDPARFQAQQPVLVRAPLRPFLPSAPHADADTSADVIRRALQDPELLECLLMARPTVAAALMRSADGTDAAAQAGLATTVRAYEQRMAHRTTPFGLFAGTATAAFGGQPRGRLCPAGHRVLSRPSAASITELVRELEDDDVVLASLRVRLSPAVTFAAGVAVLHMAAPAAQAARWRRVAVQLPVAAVEALRDGPDRTGADIATVLNGPLGTVRQLIRGGLLVTGLTPAPGERDPLRHIRDVLAASGAPDETIRRVDVLRGLHGAYEQSAVGDGTAALAALADALPPVPDAPMHGHLRLAADIELPLAARAEAERAADLLWRLRARSAAQRTLDAYHGRFIERFGTSRRVPVLKLIDSAVGLGPPGSYVGEPCPPPAVEELHDLRRRRAQLAELAWRARSDGRSEVVLSDDDLAGLMPAVPSRRPESMDLLASLIATPSGLERGDFLLVEPRLGNGPAGATSARFVSGEPRRPASAAAADGALVAEVCYRPLALRVHNALPPLGWTEHHIPIDAHFDGSPAISPADLAVTADGHRLHLVHLPTGRRVVAVSYSSVLPQMMPPLARLLVEISEVNAAYDNWWTVCDDPSPAQPRLRHGRLVLRSARWLVGQSLRDAAISPRVSAGRWNDLVARHWGTYAIPDVVAVGRGDRRVPVDLRNKLDRRLLRRQIRAGAFEVVELPGGADHEDGWLTGPVGAHRAELVVPITTPVTTPTSEQATAHRVLGHEVRYPPGSSWLEARVDTPAILQPQALAALRSALDEVSPSLRARWYFVRYRDAGRGEHLRLRFHGEPAALRADLLPHLSDWCAALHSRRLAGTLSVHTYEPDLERYGGPDLHEPCTEAFHEDSQWVLDLLRARRSWPAGLTQAGVAALSVLDLLRSFDPRAAEATYLLRVSGHPGSERPLVRRLAADDPWGPELARARARRQKAFSSYGRHARRLAASGESWTATQEVARNLVHLHCNRLLGSASPLEMAVLRLVRDAAVATGWLSPPTRTHMMEAR